MIDCCVQASGKKPDEKAAMVIMGIRKTQFSVPDPQRLPG
jgi:hypothetical protein